MSACNSELRSLENELQETTAKRKKLEEAINRVDAASKHLIEQAALQDIEAHKTQCPLPSQASRPRADVDRQPGATLQGAIAKVATIRFVEGKKEVLPTQSGGKSLPLSPVRANAMAKSSERVLAWFHRTQK
jgi:hypothetical protein